MYGCLACPKCRSVFRYPHKDGGDVVVICCDDCGYRQPIALEVVD
jgi:DNA-directed RNA polymerase subunit M/transcription elongation factor TFIIS